MGKKDSRQAPAGDPAAFVSDETRLWVEAPADMLLRTAAQLRWFEERVREVAAAGKDPDNPETWGLPPGVASYTKWLLPRMERQIADLENGRAEAEAIASRVSQYSIGSLRRYLREHPVGAECVLWLLAENRRLAQALAASEAASRAASMKNHAARDFVTGAWAARTDRGQSKQSFARAIAHEVRRRFSVTVTPDRIARYWLPRN